MRASDNDRERTLAALREHTAAGRLTLDATLAPRDGVQGFAGQQALQHLEFTRRQGQVRRLARRLPQGGGVDVG